MTEYRPNSRNKCGRRKREKRKSRKRKRGESRGDRRSKGKMNKKRSQTARLSVAAFYAPCFL